MFMRDENHHSRSLSISVLMDLSESTNALLTNKGSESQADGSAGASGQRICELMRDALLLLGETLSAVDEYFCIAGFNSNGRQQVNVIEYKQAHEPFAEVRQRLAGIHGSYSTRLGAAIRYVASQLAQQPTRRDRAGGNEHTPLLHQSEPAGFA